MPRLMTKAKANRIAGTIGKPSKMPGMSLGLPASNADFVPWICIEKGWPIPEQYGCRIGSVLSNVVGSTCYKCYADSRGNYTYPSVQIAQTKRLLGLYHPGWEEAMVYLLETTFDKLFEDALIEHLDDFFCNYHRMPRKKEMNDLHTMALLDAKYMRWHDSGDLLDVWHLERIYNVVERTPFLNHWLPVQESHVVAKCDRKCPPNLVIRHSSVMVDGPFKKRVNHVSGTTTKGDHNCHAQDNFNECGSCRKCWSHDVYAVTYPLH